MFHELKLVVAMLPDQLWNADIPRSIRNSLLACKQPGPVSTSILWSCREEVELLIVLREV